MAMYGGIEAGGTKFVCIAGTGPTDIVAETRFPTTSPQETIGKVLEFFHQVNILAGAPLVAVGIACFGPLDLNPSSPTYGQITSTPKPGWPGTDIVAEIHNALNVPVLLDTDVNGAAMGEGVWGAGQGLDNFMYLTIGTGIGGGLLIHGKPVHGLVHPEMGHIRIPHDWQEDPYSGTCPYHGDCFEGLANGPAIQARWGQPGETLPESHPAWDLEAKYIALALHSYVCVFSPLKIILGGGVMQQAHLFPRIRVHLAESLNGYIRSTKIQSNIDEYVVPPGLGNYSGVLGGLALARSALGD